MVENERLFYVRSTSESKRNFSFFHDGRDVSRFRVKTPDRRVTCYSFRCTSVPRHFHALDHVCTGHTGELGACDFVTEGFLFHFETRVRLWGWCLDRIIGSQTFLYPLSPSDAIVRH